MIDPQFLHGILSQADHAANPLFFHTATRFPRGDVCGDVDHPEIFVCQQHGIITGFSQIGINFRMSGIVKSGPVDAYFYLILLNLTLTGFHLPSPQNGSEKSIEDYPLYR